VVLSDVELAVIIADDVEKNGRVHKIQLDLEVSSQGWRSFHDGRALVSDGLTRPAVPTSDDSASLTARPQQQQRHPQEQQNQSQQK